MKLKDGLLLGRKVMSNLDSIFKSRDITLPAKIHLVKAMVFPVVVYGCELHIPWFSVGMTAPMSGKVMTVSFGNGSEAWMDAN